MHSCELEPFSYPKVHSFERWPLVSVLPRRFTDVGELMDNGANKQRNTTLSDGDQYTTPGVYFVNLWGAWQNMPVSNCFGLFEVRNIGGNILQRLTTNKSQIFFRIKQNNQPFNPWPAVAQ